MERSIAQSVHVGIQNDLRNIITEYVQKNLPQSKNLRFEKFWTETLKPTQVKATFLYSFEDVDEQGESTVVEIEGAAILNKIRETPEMSTWSLDELHILDNKVTFTEPIHITAEAGRLEGEASQADTE